jgi:hypothetical protein
VVRVTTSLPNQLNHDPLVRKCVGHRRILVGVDPSSTRAEDAFSITILEDILKPAPRIDARMRQVFEPRSITVVETMHLKRGTTYDEAIRFIAMLRRKAFAVAIDCNGPSKAVSDQLSALGVQHHQIYTTSGDVNVFKKVQWDIWRVSKLKLMSNLLSLMQSGTIKLLGNAPGYDLVTAALSTVEMTVTEYGNSVVSGKRLGSDDSALSLAYACLLIDADDYTRPQTKVKWG